MEEPTIEKLVEACELLSYRFERLDVKLPCLWWTKPGAVEVVGVDRKRALFEIAAKIQEQSAKARSSKPS